MTVRFKIEEYHYKCVLRFMIINCYKSFSLGFINKFIMDVLQEDGMSWFVKNPYIYEEGTFLCNKVNEIYAQLK